MKRVIKRVSKKQEKEFLIDQDRRFVQAMKEIGFTAVNWDSKTGMLTLKRGKMDFHDPMSYDKLEELTENAERSARTQYRREARASYGIDDANHPIITIRFPED